MVTSTWLTVTFYKSSWDSFKCSRANHLNVCMSTNTLSKNAWSSWLEDNSNEIHYFPVTHLERMFLILRVDAYLIVLSSIPLNSLCTFSSDIHGCDSSMPSLNKSEFYLNPSINLKRGLLYFTSIASKKFETRCRCCLILCSDKSSSLVCSKVSYRISSLGIKFVCSPTVFFL